MFVHPQTKYLNEQLEWLFWSHGASIGVLCFQYELPFYVRIHCPHKTMTELKLEKQLALYLFSWLIHPYSFFFVRHLGSLEWQFEVILGCCHIRLLCVTQGCWYLPGDWPLLVCVSECARMIWSGTRIGVMHSNMCAVKGLSVWPFFLSWVQGWRTLVVHLPGMASLVLPPVGSEAYWADSRKVVHPRPWCSEGEMSWTLDQQCVLRAHPQNATYIGLFEPKSNITFLI